MARREGRPERHRHVQLRPARPVPHPSPARAGRRRTRCPGARRAAGPRWRGLHRVDGPDLDPGRRLAGAGHRPDVRRADGRRGPGLAAGPGLDAALPAGRHGRGAVVRRTTAPACTSPRSATSSASSWRPGSSVPWPAGAGTARRCARSGRWSSATSSSTPSGVPYLMADLNIGLATAWDIGMKNYLRRRRAQDPARGRLPAAGVARGRRGQEGAPERSPRRRGPSSSCSPSQVR